MRSSDWSSDVCSSDLFSQAAVPWIGDEQDHEQLDIFRVIERAHAAVAERYPKASPADMAAARRLLVLSLEWSDTLGVGNRNLYRKSDVEGMSVSVRLALGGRRTIKKKKLNN